MRFYSPRLLLSLWLLLGGIARPAGAQTAATDSLRRVLARTPSDSGRVRQLLKLAYTYRASQPDSALHLAQRALALARQRGLGKGEGRSLGLLGALLREQGELPRAFACQLAARKLSRANQDEEGEAFSLNALGNISFDLRQYRQAVRYYEQSKARYERLDLPHWLAGTLTNLGSCYEKLGVLDSALLLQRRAEALIARYPRPRLAAALALRNMGAVQARLGHTATAIDYYRRALRETTRNNDLRNRAMTQYHLALLYHTLGQPDSSLHYACQAMRSAQRVAYRATVLDAGRLLARLYQARHRPDSAYHYQRLAGVAQDSLFGPEKFRQLALLALAEQQHQQLQREEQVLQTTRYQRLLLLAALGIFLIVALVLAWANRQQRQANRLLHQRSTLIEAQRNELGQALTELRTTQAQLVAAEKWAFVGEMSADIAHELQNPLAFMQKFADVSVTLLEPDNPARPLGLEQTIMAGLRQNLLQISQQGQRASSIIADMLAHARAGTSPSQPTDLNALVAKNLVLAYQAVPDWDITPAVELETDFAPDLPPVTVMPQELGRALMQLFANAFYAVRSRQRAGEPGYQPQVRVGTRRVGTAVEIWVGDNGAGMPDTVAAQVFQPFFTTKPVGEGTGLGLSLAHDIITKSHHGTLAVETREGEFTEFTVRLPA